MNGSLDGNDANKIKVNSLEDKDNPFALFLLLICLMKTGMY